MLNFSNVLNNCCETCNCRMNCAPDVLRFTAYFFLAVCLIMVQKACCYATNRVKLASCFLAVGWLLHHYFHSGCLEDVCVR